MAATVKAIYENGVFRPLEPVDLEEGQIVQVPIPVEMAIPEVTEQERQENIKALRASIKERLANPRESFEEDETPWEEFHAFLKANRMNFPERDLGLVDR